MDCGGRTNTVALRAVMKPIPSGEENRGKKYSVHGRETEMHAGLRKIAGRSEAQKYYIPETQGHSAYPKLRLL